MYYVVFVCFCGIEVFQIGFSEQGKTEGGEEDYLKIHCRSQMLDSDDTSNKNKDITTARRKTLVLHEA